MKALRKSFSKDQYQHTQISPPLPPISRPSKSVVPPQKVIRATKPYRSTAPQELSFSKGDFFYVVREVNDHGAWYEAHNPMTGARGIVPRALFEEFNKGAAPSRTSQSMNGSASPITSPGPSPPTSRQSQLRTQTFFAIVMHDFHAERTDELDAKTGDAITVVAQSNREWFVAKPIGRLGKPGLIPVSFVQVRDPITNKPVDDVDAIMDNGALPRVEDWKRQVMNYKATSIPLGTLDDPVSTGAQNGFAAPHAHSNHARTMSAAMSLAPSSEPSEHPIPEEDDSPATVPPPRIDSLGLAPAPGPCLPDGLLLSVSVTSFHYENDDYWFRIHAVFQPFDAAGTTSLPPARDLALFRAYNDFFDFQTRLLQLFPAEGGQLPPRRRILPYMPGPAERVDAALSARRCEELDEYVRRLCALNRTTARYVLEHPHVREFFAARPGDLDKGAGPQFEAMSELGWYDPTEEPEPVPATPDARAPADEEGEGEYEDERLAGRMHAARLSDGSDYGERHTNGRANGNGYLHAHTASTSSRTPSPRGHVHGKGSIAGASTYGADGRDGRDSAYSSGSGSSRWPEANSHSTHATSPTSSSGAKSRSRSASNANAHAAAMPAISASNPAPAFVKIKVFDRVQDDLIALRVHPRVPLDELVDKVRQRLGSGVGALSYRVSGSGGERYVRIEGDEELAEWVEGTERHVLYAD